MLGHVCMLVHMLLHVHANNQFNRRWIDVGDTWAGTLGEPGVGFDAPNYKIINANERKWVAVKGRATGREGPLRNLLMYMDTSYYACPYITACCSVFFTLLHVALLLQSFAKTMTQ